MWKQISQLVNTQPHGKESATVITILEPVKYKAYELEVQISYIVQLTRQLHTYNTCLAYKTREKVYIPKHYQKTLPNTTDIFMSPDPPVLHTWKINFDQYFHKAKFQCLLARVDDSA